MSKKKSEYFVTKILIDYDKNCKRLEVALSLVSKFNELIIK